MIHSPLEQFGITTLITLQLGNINISYTNVALFMILTAFLISQIFAFAVQNATIAPNPWQTIVEQIYEFISNMITEQIGHKAQSFFPYIFVLFTFIFSCNALGLIPYTCTVTSHLIVTFALALTSFIGINIIAFREHGIHFFSFFVPKDVPFALIPLLILIELASYIFRPFSLGIRLFANMMAGHTLLKIIAGFSWTLMSLGGLLFIAGTLPIIVVFAIVGLEFAIAFLQAYVFTVLVCIYLNDVIHLH